jgi:hypothetical protein
MPVNISGREHVTYDELLDKAHQQQLLGIETHLVQPPSAANENTAISHARVTMAGPDGQHRIFTGIGDANPRNTNKLIAAHTVRMSETRAKARALRDALNIKGASFEELGGDETNDAPQPEALGAGVALADPLATQQEIGRLWGAMKAFYGTEEAAKTDGRAYLKANFGKESTKELTSTECKSATKAFSDAAQCGT